MKHILGIGLITVLLILTEKVTSSYDTNDGYSINYGSEDEAASSYTGKDSTFKYSSQEDIIIKIMEAYESCKAKYPLSAEEEEALKNLDTEMEYSHDAKCFFACMFEAADLLEDGRILTENLVEYIDEEFSGVIDSREIIEYCNEEVPESEPDLCEYVSETIKCWTKKIFP